MAFLSLPDKDPEEVLDYTVDFSDLTVEGVPLLGTPTVEVESAAPTESPDALTQPIPAAYAQLGPESPLENDAVLIWLANGTLNTKYTLKITVNDDNPNARTFVRRATIKVKQK